MNVAGFNSAVAGVAPTGIGAGRPEAVPWGLRSPCPDPPSGLNEAGYSLKNREVKPRMKHGWEMDGVGRC
jgi:hypothetical protein